MPMKMAMAVFVFAARAGRPNTSLVTPNAFEACLQAGCDVAFPPDVAFVQITAQAARAGNQSAGAKASWPRQRKLWAKREDNASELREAAAFLEVTSSPLHIFHHSSEEYVSDVYSEDGYHRVAAKKDDAAMQVYIEGLLDRMGLHVLDEGSLKGLVPFFSGTTATQSFGQLVSELKAAPWLSKSPPPPTEASIYTSAVDVPLNSTHPDEFFAVVDKLVEPKPSPAPNTTMEAALIAPTYREALETRALVETVLSAAGDKLDRQAKLPKRPYHSLKDSANNSSKSKSSRHFVSKRDLAADALGLGPTVAMAKMTATRFNVTMQTRAETDGQAKASADLRQYMPTSEQMQKIQKKVEAEAQFPMQMESLELVLRTLPGSLGGNSESFIGRPGLKHKRQPE